MVDRIDKLTRSRNMSRIRSKDTAPERRVRSALHRLGFRFRKHKKDLPGTPDLYLRKWNAAIEIHGCFFHRHQGCRLTTNPEDPEGKWAAKFAANVARDRRNKEGLQAKGIRVAIVWQCAIEKLGDGAVADRLEAWLKSAEKSVEIGAY